MSMESTPIELHKVACKYAESHSCEDGGAYDGFVAGAVWLIEQVREVINPSKKLKYGRCEADIVNDVIDKLDELTRKD